MSQLTSCPGCGLDLPSTEGPTHAYMLSSPACWALFGEILAREYEDPACWPAHQNTVDAYAVQHPGGADRRAVQSVHLHLVSLYLRLELGWSDAAAKTAKQTLAKDLKSAFETLAPPEAPWPRTVHDLHQIETAAGHRQMAEEWARSAWRGWRACHEKIAAMVSPHV